MFKSLATYALGVATAFGVAATARAESDALSLAPRVEKSSAPAAKAEPTATEVKAMTLAVQPGQMGVFEGAKTISISGQFSHTAVETGTDSDNYDNSYSIDAQLGLGYFITKNIEIKGNFGAGVNFTDQSDSESGFINYGAQLNYHFLPYNRFDPYIGALGGGITNFNSGDNHTTGFVGGAVGLNFFASESTSFFVEYNFIYSRDSDIDTFQNIVRVGIEFFIH